MPGNTLTGLFQTLVVPATAKLAAPLALKNSLIRKVYYQEQPVPGTFGQTVNVNIPVVNENDVVDIGNGPIQITDGDQATVPMVVNNNKSWSRRIPDFDRVRTPVDFLDLYLKPGIESVTRKINRQVANLITPANFSAYTTVLGGSSVFSRVNLAAAWANLVGQGVPITDGEVHFVSHHVPYSTMISDPTQNFIQQFVVGQAAAESAQQRAVLMPAFNADMDYDQQMPQPAATTYSGLYFNKNAIAFIPVQPPPPIAPEFVKETYYQPEGTGLVFRIQMWMDPAQQAVILHINCMFALTVVRSNFGSYMVTQ